MGLMNKSLIEILGDVGKSVAKNTYKIGKSAGKELFEEGLGLAKITYDVGNWAVGLIGKNKGKYFESIKRKDGESLFQIIFGAKMKTGHVGEGKFAQKIRNFEPLKFGTINEKGKRVFSDGDKVGFIPKVAEWTVNGAYKGAVNLPFNLINKVALSPGGRLGTGIALGGLAYGTYKGAQANTLVNAESGELVNMANQTISPLLEDDTALEKIQMGMNNHGAEGNLIFALHNLRNGG